MNSDPLQWIDESLAALEREGLRRRLVSRDGSQRPVVSVAGRELINFSSNDYLGLAEPLLADMLDCLEGTGGWGSGASPLVTGRGPLHAALERELAEFEGTPAALLFGSGYAANVGAITALASKGDAIYSDERNHASIIDGCRLSRAEVRVYRHCDAAHLRELLRDAKQFRRRLVVTDGLFSMDGDLAPLPALAELAAEYDAMLMVDEAHATGVLGERGRGTHEHFGVEDGVHVRVGTLSKALGSIGGFVAGSASLIEWLANRARPYVFSTAQPEFTCVAGLAALRHVRERADCRRRLLQAAADLRVRLTELGWDTAQSESQIIPVVIGEPEETMRHAERLRGAGILVPGIRPPSVPDGQSLLRVSLTTSHLAEMIDRLVHVLGPAPRRQRR